MKRLVVRFLLVAAAFSVCSFAEPLIFDFGSGTLSFSGGVLSGNITVVDARVPGGTSKTCTGCTFSFTTGAGSENVGSSAPPFFYSYSFGANNSSTAFQVTYSGAGFSLPGQDGSPYANGTVGGTSVIAGDLNPPTNSQYLYGSSAVTANEASPFSADFLKLLQALGLPPAAVGGSIVFNFASGGQPGASSFTVGVTGGSLEIDVTPEPGTWLMLGGGLLGLGLLRRRSARV